MPTTITTDPVCGMVLESQMAPATCTYAGWTYLFCCEECRDIFLKSPNDCILYLAHSSSGHLGHLCQRQRTAWQPFRREALR